MNYYLNPTTVIECTCNDQKLMSSKHVAIVRLHRSPQHVAYSAGLDKEENVVLASLIWQSAKSGSQTPNGKALVIRTPTRRTANLLKQPYADYLNPKAPDHRKSEEAP